MCENPLVPKEGLEPSRPYGQRILNPPRLPFRHFGAVAHATPRTYNMPAYLQDLRCYSTDEKIDAPPYPARHGTVAP